MFADKLTLFQAAAVCHAADALPPVLPLSNSSSAGGALLRCGIAANYNPYGEDASPFPLKAPPTLQGPLEAAELQLSRGKLGNVSMWLAEANSDLDLSPPVELSIVLLDSERFGTLANWPGGTPNSAWNRAITRKHDLFLNLTRELLPNTPVEFYDYGAAGRSDTGTATGWSTEEYFTLHEDTSVYAVSLYSIWEIGYTREAYERTVATSIANNVSNASVIPWLSLGCGYRRCFENGQVTYDFRNYDYIYSWQLGSEINNKWYGDHPNQFAHWNQAPHVVFYPAIFDSRMANVSISHCGAISPWLAGMHHFVAYVMGASCESCSEYGCKCQNWGDPTLPPIQIPDESPSPTCCKTDDADVIAPAEYAVPIITKISQVSFAVEGGSNSFLVEGYGVAATYAGAPPNACRLQPRPGESAWTHVSGFLNDARTVLELNSTVVHANTTCKPGCFHAPANRSCCFAVVRCDAPPAVIVPGPGSLSVRNNVGWSNTGGVPGLVSTAVEYVYLLDVAIGRRPYVKEREGHLLFRCNASVLGTAVAVTADIPSIPSARWHWTVTLNGSNVLGFDLSALPATVNADLRIIVKATSAGKLPDVTKWRRFMRAPAQYAAGVEPVQIDHHRRGLLVDGEPFLGSGWYVGTNSMDRGWDNNVSASLEALTLQAKLGDTMEMPYSLGWWPAVEQIALLDGCHERGLKIMYPLAPMLGKQYQKPGAAAGPWFRRLDTAWGDPQWQADVRSNVSLVKDHPALLGESFSPLSFSCATISAHPRRPACCLAAFSPHF
jgi:hypothetical protein